MVDFSQSMIDFIVEVEVEVSRRMFSVCSEPWCR